MPWTPKQHRLFEAAAHDPAVAASHGMTQAKASQMAGEGVKAQAVKKVALVKALRERK